MGVSILMRESIVSVIFDSLTTFSNTIDFSLSFSINPLSYAFSLLVIVIGVATNVYSLNYFKGEADESSFIF